MDRVSEKEKDWARHNVQQTEIEGSEKQTGDSNEMKQARD